jgi:hypothetical protein
MFVIVVAARAPYSLFQKSPGGIACSGWGTRPEACEHVAPTELARGGWEFLHCYKRAAPTELKRKLFNLLTLEDLFVTKILVFDNVHITN